MPEGRTTTLVGRASFERSLVALEANHPNTEEGFFGPRSEMWRIGREAFVFLGAGPALLLQAAHPAVAQAVADHSRALDDPIGRYHRTFRSVFAMIFGTTDQALAQARVVRCVHDRIEGALPEGADGRYSASDPEALLWVHATLWHTSIAVYERVRGPLPLPVKNQYYDETRRFAALFGIPADIVPRDWTDFTAYVDTMCAGEALTVGAAARRIGAFFLQPGSGWPGRLVPGWYRALTATFLPPRLARDFGLPCDAAAHTVAGRALRRIRFLDRHLPDGLRYVGPYQEAMSRLSGRARPGLRIALINRFWLGRSQLEPRPS